MKPIIDFHSYYETLDESQRVMLDRFCEKGWAPHNQIICKQGSESEAVFIIEDGMVEVIMEVPGVASPTPTAYVSRGDMVGELGILNERPRSATLRAASDVVYRRLSRDNFEHLLTTFPGFAIFIAKLLAHRLGNTPTQKSAYNSAGAGLSGKLPDFDLLTVFQTLRDSSLDGEFILSDINSAAEIAGLFIVEGAICAAHYGHLKGREAVWQLFITADQPAAFAFKPVEVPSFIIDNDNVTHIEINDVLMQGAVKRDEFHQLARGLRRMEGEVKRLGIQLKWMTPEIPEVSLEVWRCLEYKPHTMLDIWHACSGSMLIVGQTVQYLLDTKQAEYHPAPDTTDTMRL
jgi:CRP-like cAMP-binding protein